ncbi:hypothetical protein HYH03_002495 [Edaphochlamys debaryana]|uniref:Uncharacterized protein n=1 Tax=Edaphochlamys debaryana TaxID=47281 RepID=A0A835YJ48_9CHLO|nr:hypothetical protein HYH03_002495 [Edaphochlamys debaryana]|eukprot:KAG2499550.1 hypothetical protein HYH03_002495 [Edaphochlamys debaryana]
MAPHMLVSLLALVSAAAVQAVSQAPIQRGAKQTLNLFIYGDSLSDTGYSFAINGGAPEARLGYWRGRFTNGPNWVDNLNATLSAGQPVQIYNYATAGATACNLSNAQPIYQAMTWIRNLTVQVGAFQQDVAAGKIPLPDSSNRNVAIIMVGVNDLAAFLYTVTTNPALAANTTELIARATQVGRDIVACRLQGAAALLQTGRVTDVILMPLTPVWMAPAVPAFFKPQVQLIATGIDQGIIPVAATTQAALNAVPALSNARIHTMGLSSEIEAGILALKPPFGNLVDACVTNQTTSQRVEPGAVACSNPTDYGFFDDIHPSARFHKYLAQRFLLPRLQQLRLVPRRVPLAHLGASGPQYAGPQ